MKVLPISNPDFSLKPQYAYLRTDERGNFPEPELRNSAELKEWIDNNSENFLNRTLHALMAQIVQMKGSYFPLQNPSIEYDKPSEIHYDQLKEDIENLKMELGGKRTFQDGALLGDCFPATDDPITSKPMRKLYLAPHPDKIVEFIKKFYEFLDKTDLKICGVKISGSPFHCDNKGKIVSQAHNTFIVYMNTDDQLAEVLKLLKKADIEVNGALNQNKNIPHTASFLKGRALLGLDRPQYSFDEFTACLYGAMQSEFSSKFESVFSKFEKAMSRAREIYSNLFQGRFSNPILLEHACESLGVKFEKGKANLINEVLAKLKLPAELKPEKYLSLDQ